MRISIRHQLSVTPPPGTAHLVLQLLLSARSGPTQQVESWSVEMDGIDTAASFNDAYANSVHLVNLTRPEGELLIVASGIVETRDTHGVLGRPGGEPVPALYSRVTPLTRAPVTLYGKYRGSKESRLSVLHALMARVGETLAPQPAAEQSQSQSQSGQSQSQSQSQGAMAADGTPAATEMPRPPASDYAHLFVGACRALNIPARFVTGYLVGDEDDPSGPHCWAEAFDERLGWIGFDPKLQLCPTERHLRLAVGLDSLTTTPVRAVPAGDGVVEGPITVEVL